jgi:hypothetical protein
VRMSKCGFVASATYRWRSNCSASSSSALQTVQIVKQEGDCAGKVRALQIVVLITHNIQLALQLERLFQQRPAAAAAGT